MAQLVQDLNTNASVATSLAAQQVPDFGINASSLRSVVVINASMVVNGTANGTTYLINIKLNVTVVSV